MMPESLFVRMLASLRIIVKLRPAALRRREIIYYHVADPCGSLPVPSSLFKDLEVNDRQIGIVLLLNSDERSQIVSVILP